MNHDLDHCYHLSALKRIRCAGMTLIEVGLALAIFAVILVINLAIIDHYRKKVAFENDLKKDVRNFNAVVNAAQHYFEECPAIFTQSVSVITLVKNQWGDIDADPRNNATFKHIDIISNITPEKIPGSQGINIIVKGQLTNGLLPWQVSEYARALNISMNWGAQRHVFTMTRYVIYPTYESNDFGLGYDLGHYGQPARGNTRCNP
jgi:type II secretory pathway pseudopilin PulG